MSDPTTVAIIAIITSLGSLVVIFGKTIKNSTCLGCLKCETRTPPNTPAIMATPAPTPHQSPPTIQKRVEFLPRVNGLAEEYI